MAKVISQLPSGGSVPKHNNLLGLNEGDYLHLTQFEKAKLDGIQSGAEVNVNADWNAVSGDAQILNKPASFPPSTHTHTISEVINLQNELNSKENISNKVNTISGNSSTEYPTEKAVVDYVSSQIGADFAKVVYFDNVTPNVASIFDLNNPPLVNDPSLKEDVANLYIGTDASTWVYVTSPAGYVTKTVTSSGSNFYITGTSTDAGSIKTGSITKKGQFVIDSEVVNDSGLTLKKTESSILKTDSLGKVVKATNLQDVEYAPIVHTHTVSQITDFPTFKTIEGQSIIGAGNIDLDKNSVGLGNVDNTSDLNKIISTATQTALNTKANISGQVFTGAVSATNLSGTNTGDNAPNSLYSGLVTNATHTGEVTGSTALTITNGAVTNAKLANVATSTLKGRVSATTGVVEDLTASQVRTLLNVADGANNYVHPANHLASIITQDASNRFVTDTEKSAWNAKEPAITSGTTSQYWRGDKTWQSFPAQATVDQTIIDGSTNAVSGNAVFDELTLKANDNNVVKLTGNQLISGIKTLSNNVSETRLQLTNTATSTREVLRVINPSGSVANGSEFYNSSSSLGKGAIYVNSSGAGVGLLSEITSGSSNTNAIRVEVPSVTTIENAVVFNTATNSNLENHLAFKVNNQNVATVSKSGAVTAKSFTKSGGTSSQFLKADGSVDSNTYLTSASLITVDQTIIDGSTNAVSGNAVFDALAIKAPISSVHNPVTLGSTNGLSLSNQQLSLGLASSGVTGALSGTDWNTFNNKQPAITGLTTNYLPKWNGSGFGNSQIFDNGTNIGIGTTTPNAKFDVAGNIISSLINSYPTIAVFNEGTVGFPLLQLINVKNGVQKGWNIENGRTVFGDLGFYNLGGQRVTIKDNGRVLINKTDDDLTNQLQVAGTISASPATTANQVVVKSQLDAVASSGTYTPSNQTNAAQTVNFIRSYWERKGNVLTVTTSLTYTVTQIQSTASFLITLPNGFLVSGANGRIIGSSLLHTTQVIFNNNANMKAYEASDSSQINLQANFQATVSSGTYETTIIYTVLIQ